MLSIRNYLAFALMASVSMPAFCSQDAKKDSDFERRSVPLETSGGKKHKTDEDACDAPARVQDMVVDDEIIATAPSKEPVTAKKRGREDDAAPVSLEREDETPKKAATEAINLTALRSNLAAAQQEGLSKTLLTEFAGLSQEQQVELANVMANIAVRDKLAFDQAKLEQIGQKYLTSPLHKLFAPSLKHYALIFSVLAKCQAKEMSSFFQSAARICEQREIPLCRSKDNFSTILKCLSSASESRLKGLEDMLVFVWHEYGESMDAEDIVDTLNNFLLIPDERVVVVYEAFKPLSTMADFGATHEHIIKYLLRFSDDGLEKAVQNLQYIHKYDRVAASLKLFNSLPDDCFYKLNELMVSTPKAPALASVLCEIPKELLIEKAKAILSLPSASLIEIIEDANKISAQYQHSFRRTTINFVNIFNFFFKFKDVRFQYLVDSCTKLKERDLTYILNIPEDLNRDHLELIIKIFPQIKTHEAVQEDVELKPDQKEKLDATIKLIWTSKSDHILALLKSLEPLDYLWGRKKPYIGQKCDFINLCLNAPFDRLEGMLSKLVTCKGLTIAYCTRILDYMLHIPEVEYEKLTDTLLIMTSGIHTPSLLKLDKISYAHMHKILVAAHTYYEKIELSPDQRRYIYQEIAKIPEQNLDAVLQIVDGFFLDVKKLNSKVLTDFSHRYQTVINAFNEVNLDRLSILKDVAITVIKDTDARLESAEDQSEDGVDFGMIIRKLNDITPARLESSVAKAGLIAKDTNWLDFEQVLIAVFVSTLNIEKMDDTLLAANQINKGHKKWTGYSHAMAIKILDLTSQNGRNVLFQNIENMLGNEKLDVQDIEGVMHSIEQTLPFIPEDLLEMLFNLKMNLWATDPSKVVNKPELQDDLIDMVAAAIKAGDGSQDLLFKHWIAILNQEDEARASKLSGVIADNFLEFGLSDESELVQHAFRVESLLDNDDYSPFTIFKNLKEKRMLPLDWTQIDASQVVDEGVCFTLNHQGLASFGASLELDLTTVPKFGQSEFVQLLTGLKEALLGSEQLLKQAAHMIRTLESKDSEEAEEQAMSRLSKQFLKLIDTHMKKKSHMSFLLNLTGANIEASKLKCVLRYFSLMEDIEKKHQRLCQFLAGVRNCDMGQNTAIQDYYVSLPQDYKLQSKAGALAMSSKESPALKALLNAIQSVVSMQFSPESAFMRQQCDVKGDEEIDQAAHQINYMKGLIGDVVGLSEGAKYDSNAQCIHKPLLKLSRQDALKIYYQYMKLDRMIPLVKTAFEGIVRDERSGQRNEIYPSLVAIHQDMPQAKGDDLSTWVDDDEETFAFKGLTTRGTLRIIQRAGVLDQME